MAMDWDDLKILIALERGGSIVAAAREMKVDASTVSRRLAAIENALGAMLVRRGGKNFGFTAEGGSALQYAKQIEQLVIEAQRTVQSAKQSVAGRVRISAPAGIVLTLSKTLPDMHKQHPLLTIELSAQNYTVDLSKGEADIALRMFKPTEANLVCRQVAEVGWGVFASKVYAARHGLPASVDVLSNHSLVCYVEKLHGVTGLRWMEGYLGSASKVTRVDDAELAANMIASGAGIGVTTFFLAARYPELVRVFAEPTALTTGWIVYHESLRNTARVRVVVDFMVKHFQANQALYSGRIA